MNIETIEKKLNLSETNLVRKDVGDETIKGAAEMLLYLNFCSPTLGF